VAYKDVCKHMVLSCRYGQNGLQGSQNGSKKVLLPFVVFCLS
jgi:hypothetical protein